MISLRLAEWSVWRILLISPQLSDYISAAG